MEMDSEKLTEIHLIDNDPLSHFLHMVVYSRSSRGMERDHRKIDSPALISNSCGRRCTEIRPKIPERAEYDNADGGSTRPPKGVLRLLEISRI